MSNGNTDIMEIPLKPNTLSFEELIELRLKEEQEKIKIGEKKNNNNNNNNNKLSINIPQGNMKIKRRNMDNMSTLKINTPPVLYVNKKISNNNSTTGFENEKTISNSLNNQNSKISNNMIDCHNNSINTNTNKKENPPN